jgi:hypothetical protein
MGRSRRGRGQDGRHLIDHSKGADPFGSHGTLFEQGKADMYNACEWGLMMKGEIEATTLTEPYVTLAEKKGCRTICSAFFHGTEVASERVDAEWVKSWGMLEQTDSAIELVNVDVQTRAHAVA